MSRSEPEHYFFTPDGLERLRRRIDEARAAYKAVCDSNPEAREAGDSSVWHDNFAFEENQRQMHQLARRVRELEQIWARSRVVTPSAGPCEHVAIGREVVYRFEGEDSTRRCLLVGYDDGEPSQGRVSYNSPLGVALLGAGSGEVREVRLTGRLRPLEVLEVRAPHA